MNKYASLYLNKLSEEVSSDPHLNQGSKKQDTGIAGGLGAIGSLFWPLGAAAPGIYAAGQSKSLGEGLRAAGNGLVWPIVGTAGGALAGTAVGGVAGLIIDKLLRNQGGVDGFKYNISRLDPNAIPAAGLGAVSGMALGGLLGGPIAGYLGSRNAARRYNERLDKSNEPDNLLRDRQVA